jgi:chemotaxis protein MotB
MAENEKAAEAPKGKGKDEAIAPRKKKAEEHVNHERWLVSYADFITLLFAFFTVLYAVSSADKAKVEKAQSSIKKAFEGPQLFSSSSEGIGAMNSNELRKAFPIEFQTGEGLLEKNEINRQWEGALTDIKKVINENELRDAVDFHEIPTGVQIKFKEKVFFKKNDLTLEKISMELYQKIIKILSEENWILVIEGHSSMDEGTEDFDPMELAGQRAQNMAKSMFRRGVRDAQVVIMNYGNTRPDFAGAKDQEKNRRVEFIMRRIDPRELGHKIF